MDHSSTLRIVKLVLQHGSLSPTSPSYMILSLDHHVERVPHWTVMHKFSLHLVWSGPVIAGWLAKLWRLSRKYVMVENRSVWTSRLPPDVSHLDDESRRRYVEKLTQLGIDDPYVPRDVFTDIVKCDLRDLPLLSSLCSRREAVGCYAWLCLTTATAIRYTINDYFL